MSKRPIRIKQAARMRKALLRGTADSYIDLVQWLMDRGHAQTKGEARKMLADGRVKSESHPVGVETPYVSTSVRKTLVVVDA